MSLIWSMVNMNCFWFIIYVLSIFLLTIFFITNDIFNQSSITLKTITLLVIKSFLSFYTLLRYPQIFTLGSKLCFIQMNKVTNGNTIPLPRTVPHQKQQIFLTLGGPPLYFSYKCLTILLVPDPVAKIVCIEKP
jgi:hypothetical protein